MIERASLSVSASQEWRCFHCGARYFQEFQKCFSCFAEFTLFPVGHRAGCEFDKRPVITDARTLSRMAWQEVKHEVFKELKIGVGALVYVVQAEDKKAHRSTWVYRLLDSLPGPVLVVASGSGCSPELATALIAANVKRETFYVVSRASCDAILELATAKKVVGCAIRDVSWPAWAPDELRHFMNLVPTLTTMLIDRQRQDKDDRYHTLLWNEADIGIIVEEDRWCVAGSRYQQKDMSARPICCVRKELAANTTAPECAPSSGVSGGTNGR